MKAEIHVGFAGNPNCGKTTLFNAYTGANLKVANWPGVTVEKKEGYYKQKGHHLKLVDLPGIYSLTCYTMEEKLTREYILDSDIDVIINIIDASNLERNLYLTLQLIELGKPIILALNMMDIVEDRGMRIDIPKLSAMLGLPVVPVSARRRTGLDVLMNAVLNYGDAFPKEYYGQSRNMQQHSGGQKQGRPSLNRYIFRYSDDIENKIGKISGLLMEKYTKLNNPRWYAVKLMEMDEAVMAEYPVDLSGTVRRSYEEDMINQKYDYIERIISEVLINKAMKAASTDRVDAILTHRYFGLPIFLFIMAAVFFLTFEVGGLLKISMEIVLGDFSKAVLFLLNMIHAGDFITSLIVDGIIAGVVGILTFLPNIFILFLALAYLEDSGYMARVAYIMDGIMGKLGMSGRAFIPMLLGFGCNVPAIMASRTLENMRDRRKTILVTPFMSCSARLPVYVLFSQMFFGKWAMLAAYSMYLIGILTAIAVMFVLYKKSDKNLSNSLLIELPEYKTPNQRTIIIYVWEKIKEYLTKAGTTIFAASVVIWFILNFGPGGMVSDMSQSFGAMLGRAAVPVLAPAGLGMWQVAVALISGIAAKEVVVSSFGVLFKIGNITTQSGMASLSGILMQYGFGALNAYALMVFCLLYVPCTAAIGVIRREMHSMKWTLFTIVFQFGIAMLAATLVYQIGSLFLK